MISLPSWPGICRNALTATSPSRRSSMRHNCIFPESSATKTSPDGSCATTASTAASAIRANIVWACPDHLSDADIEALVEATALTGVVDALPNGLDTIVGDRGHRLSGGERQRVALARAMARRPGLLVLDEATSALDDDNEQSVQAAIEGLRGNVAMLVIAHRLSTIRNADEIVVLDAGRVVERAHGSNSALRTDVLRRSCGANRRSEHRQYERPHA